MSQTEAQRSSSGSAPGKVFLLGEYAVLAGKPAALLALAPRFECVHRNFAGSEAFAAFPEKSPVGRLLRWAVRLSPKLPDLGYFVDPLAGAGGFGASTAQYLLAYTQLAQALDWERGWLRAWTLYRELMSDEPIVPSGADLVSQALGGLTVFSSERLLAERLDGVLDPAALLVFAATGHAGRKVATHEHLRSIADRGLIEPGSLLLATLAAPLAQGLAALRSGSHERLGPALTAYAEALAGHGLEAPAAREDRLALHAIEGVIGVKGAGALLSDGVVVCVRPDTEVRAQVIAAASARGLKHMEHDLGPGALSAGSPT